MAKIQLKYFKASGKFYSDGHFQVVDTAPMYTVFDTVKTMQLNKMLPGFHKSSSAQGRIVCQTGGGKHP